MPLKPHIFVVASAFNPLSVAAVSIESAPQSGIGFGSHRSHHILYLYYYIYLFTYFLIYYLIFIFIYLFLPFIIGDISILLLASIRV